MRTLVVLSTIALFLAPAVSQDAAERSDTWRIPNCKRIAGTSSIAITSDEGATLTTAGRPLWGTDYAFGLAVLPDVPSTMLLAHGRELQRSTSAGCRWKTVGEIASTSDGFPSSLVAARGDRAFAWSENRNDLARIDGTTILYLASPVSSINGIATDPVDPDRLRLGAGDGTLWESTDGGLRWAQVGAQVPGGFFLVYRTAFDPNDLDHAVVGVVTGGAFVTFDGGRTWTQATGLSSIGTGPVNVFNVVISPADRLTVFAMGLDIAESDAGAPSQGRHIYLSRDGGLSFHPVVDASAEVFLPNGPPMAAHPTNPHVVYFTFGSSFQGYGADLYRYDDGTGSVTQTHNSYHSLPAIAFNPADPTFLYLGLGVENVF